MGIDEVAKHLPSLAHLLVAGEQAGVHDDDAGDALEAALGHEVDVKARGNGIVVELRFDDLREAHELARELRRRAK